MAVEIKNKPGAVGGPSHAPAAPAPKTSAPPAAAPPPASRTPSAGGIAATRRLQAAMLGQDATPNQVSSVSVRLLQSAPVLREGASLKAAPELLQLQGELRANALDALAAPTFSARNQKHAAAVGTESALLALKAGGIASDERLVPQRLTQLFERACSEAGAMFRPAFDESGKKLADKEPEYKKAMSAAGGVALRALPELLAILDPGKPAELAHAKQIVQSARLEDIAAIVQNDLGLPTSLDGPKLKALIDKVVPQDDYFRSEVANLPVRAEGEQGLTGSDLQTLSMGIRLANSTWKSGQVHRAAWEGNDSRIDPAKRGGVYNPYDVLKVAMYNESLQKAGSADGGNLAFARVVFEVYKDLLELKKAAG